MTHSFLGYLRSRKLPVFLEWSLRLPGPDAGDLFPHQWMVQTESQWAG